MAATNNNQHMDEEIDGVALQTSLIRSKVRWAPFINYPINPSGRELSHIRRPQAAAHH